MTIRLIGAGLGRTGTLSIKAALEQLGYGPCYHMAEVIKNPSHAKMWQSAAEGKPVDWPSLFGDYQATVDFPACSFYQELMTAYPDAKVLLSVRDPNSWYESAHETIYQMLEAVPAWSHRLPWVGDLYQMTMRLLWDGHFHGRFEDRDYAIGVFTAWNAEVVATVPPEKLLVFNVKEGWEPLCAFLGVPVPNTPFPHANDRAQMLMGRKALRLIKRWTPLVPWITVAWVTYLVAYLKKRQHEQALRAAQSPELAA